MLQKKKVDIIALSKTRWYKITMFSLLGLGLISMVAGFIMLGSLTGTMPPNKLEITHLSGSQQITSTSYTMIISQDEPLNIDTGIGDRILDSDKPIVFTLQNGAENFLKPIPSMQQSGIARLQLKDTAQTGDSGDLLITCRTMPTIIVKITVKK